jgi:integrase
MLILPNTGGSMSKGKGNRVYWRRQSKAGTKRAYGDFRDFADVGGRQEALIPPGTKRATDDPLVAEVLAANRVVELQERRRHRVLFGVDEEADLATFVAHHLREKHRAGRVSERCIEDSRLMLGRAIEFLGATRTLGSIRVKDVADWLASLRTRPGREDGGGLGASTLRHHLFCLSNLFRRAESEGLVLPGFNPVSALLEKPAAKQAEAEWLEVDKAAVFLEGCRNPARSTRKGPIQNLEAIIATFLLTGGRQKEVLGLEVSDVSFERKTVTFRPNEWRGLKTRSSQRVLPLWPQLEEVLTGYLEGPTRPKGALLFPNRTRGAERPFRDLRKALDAVSKSLEFPAGSVRTKAFRHTYCAARLQTLDRGEPVSLWTVAKEMGHSGTGMVEKVYGHLGSVRVRRHEVEFRTGPNGSISNGGLEGGRPFHLES